MIIHFIQSGVLASLFFASLVALLSVPLYQKVRNNLIQLPCLIRSKILTLWLLSPFFMVVLLTLSGVSPSWMNSHEIVAEHCSTHTNGIAHLCWFDPIVHLSEVFWIAGATIIVSLLIFTTYKIIKLLIKHWRFQTTLHVISECDSHHNVFRIASEHLFVFSAGLFAPRVFISSQLITKLSEQQLDVVLSHEQAHCRRRDVLQRFILNVASLLHFSGTRQNLLSDLELAHEQICDDDAAQHVGDRFLVAETIIKIARHLTLSMPEKKLGISAFNGSHIDIRIQQLLEQPKPLTRLTMLVLTILVSLFLYSVLALTMPMHHLL